MAIVPLVCQCALYVWQFDASSHVFPLHHLGNAADVSQAPQRRDRDWREGTTINKKARAQSLSDFHFKRPELNVCIMQPDVVSTQPTVRSYSP